MNEEIRRSRELLKSAEETLERARNRPERHSSWLDDSAEPRFTREAQEVVDSAARERQAASQGIGKAYVDKHFAQMKWVEMHFVTQKSLERQVKALAKGVGAALGKREKVLSDRIEALEAEIEGLKQRQPAPSQEWPLRSVQGGKR